MTTDDVRCNKVIFGFVFGCVWSVIGAFGGGSILTCSDLSTIVAAAMAAAHSIEDQGSQSPIWLSYHSYSPSPKNPKTAE
mmetsp:Transcript_36055/g.73184  ORF Transcript_36055/g.73184 Transcript_36055/m.73184 type:complete len:80 (-) Transcript_36055:366-605(-)